jgi:hypothetical protein
VGSERIAVHLDDALAFDNAESRAAVPFISYPPHRAPSGIVLL